jgi:hypothetical protein
MTSKRMYDFSSAINGLREKYNFDQASCEVSFIFGQWLKIKFAKLLLVFYPGTKFNRNSLNTMGIKKEQYWNIFVV